MREEMDEALYLFTTTQTPGLVQAGGNQAMVRIHNTNTKKIIVSRFPIDDGRAAVDGDRAVLTVRVTNRAAFRMRLYALGTRVKVLGPDDARKEILDELGRIAGDA